MTRSGRDDTEATQEESISEDYTDHDQDPAPEQHDPKKVQRLAALKKAQATRMANADIKRKEKALSDYESLQRKDEISRKFDELQERLANPTKSKAKVVLKEEPEDVTDQDDTPAISVKKSKQKLAPVKKKKPVPKKVVYVEESESSSSEDEEPEQVVIRKKKKKPKPKPKKKIVYESSDSDSGSDDGHVHNVRKKAAMYYKLMFS
jgi:hypothetical protein